MRQPINLARHSLCSDAQDAPDCTHIAEVEEAVHKLDRAVGDLENIRILAAEAWKWSGCGALGGACATYGAP